VVVLIHNNIQKQGYILKIPGNQMETKKSRKKRFKKYPRNII